MAARLDQFDPAADYECMNGQNTMSEHTAKALLASSQRTLDKFSGSVEAIQATLQALQRIADKQQETIGSLQVDVASIKESLNHCATSAEVISIRAELFRTLAIYIVKGFIWMSAVCSALSGAVYYIARNVR